ncbi:MAG: carbohydrate kinase family protein [Opitutales bacterium]
MSGYDLVSVGLVAVDVLVRLPREVRANDKQMVEELIIQGGAPVGSGSAGVAMPGYRVGMVARMGENTLSAVALEQFSRYGVSTDLVVRDATSRPAIALVEIDPVTSERTVFIQMDDYGYLRPEDIPVEVIRDARALLVDSYDLDATGRALRAAGPGCRTVLDFESGDPARLRELIGLGTDVILPLAAARELAGAVEPEEVLRALAGWTEGQVVVTDGIRGSWAWERESGQVVNQAAFKVESVDSTGCGDAYHAGYIIGLLEGWALPLRMEMGSLLASRVATQVGGRSALPGRTQLPELLRPDVSESLRRLLYGMAGKAADQDARAIQNPPESTES